MRPAWISAAISRDFSEPELLERVQVQLGVLERDGDVLGESVEEREILRCELAGRGPGIDVERAAWKHPGDGLTEDRDPTHPPGARAGRTSPPEA